MITRIVASDGGVANVVPIRGRADDVDPNMPADGANVVSQLADPDWLDGRFAIAPGAFERAEERKTRALGNAIAIALRGAAKVPTEDDGGVSLPASTETVDEWAARHFAWREKQGTQTHADAGRKWRNGIWGGRYGTWISPLIGSKAVATLTRDDVEDVRDSLNRAVLAYYTTGKGDGATSYKNALNIWSTLVTACKVMAHAERDTRLKVRADNPALGVRLRVARRR